jgi:hypothetical protein
MAVKPCSLDWPNEKSVGAHCPAGGFDAGRMRACGWLLDRLSSDRLGQLHHG